MMRGLGQKPFWRLVGVFLWVAQPALGQDRPDPKMRQADWVFLENDHLRVGFSLAHGGALGWISRKGPGSGLKPGESGENLVNIHDPGRWIQGSYYSGPQPFGKPHPGWPNWPWNPVQAGDAFGNRAGIVEHQIKDGVFVCKTIPLQWALNHQPAEAVMETRVSLKRRAIHWSQTLLTTRPDPTLHPGRDQELPALYAIGRLSRVVHGPDADRPDGPVTSIAAPPRQPPPPRWNTVRSAEGWVALVDETGQGLGLIHPGAVRFLAGHYGEPGRGGSLDDATGYLAAIRRECLEPKGAYSHQAILLVGSVEEIRSLAREHRPRQGWSWRPEKDRDHGVPFQIKDSPLEGGGRTWICDQMDPQWVFPDLAIPAARVGSIQALVRAHPHPNGSGTEQLTTALRFERADRPGQLSEPILAKIPLDGTWKSITFAVGRDPLWQGAISKLRWDPLEGGPQGIRIDVRHLQAIP